MEILEKNMSAGVLKARDLFQEALDGNRRAQGSIKALVEGQSLLSEAITTSDLANSFIFGINADVQQLYKAQEPTWRDWAKPAKLNDFKPAFLRELVLDQNTELPVNGGNPTAVWSLPVVPEMTEYPVFGYSVSAKALATLKRGARVAFGWEAIINDEWHLIEELPGKLAEFASNSEETSAYGQLVTSTGVNTATFNSGNGNTNVAGHLFDQEYKLSLNSLALAKRELRNRKYNGAPILVPSFRLIVPRVMEEYAKNLLNIREATFISADGQTRMRGEISNSDVKLTVSDTLSRMNLGANASSTWFLVPDGGFDGTRTTVSVNFLRGHETPLLTQSTTGHALLGGGSEVPFFQGSLLNDDMQYRIRHVVSGTGVNVIGLLASAGTYGTDAPATYHL